MAIHGVHMDPVGTSGIDGAHLLAELGEIGGQYRGRDEERAAHRFPLQYAVRLTRCPKLSKLAGAAATPGAHPYTGGAHGPEGSPGGPTMPPPCHRAPG